MPNGVPPQSTTGYVTLPDGTRVPTVKPPGSNVTWDDTKGWVTAPQGNPNESFTSYEDALARWTYQQKVAQFGTKVPAPPGWKPSPMPEGWGGSKPQGYGQPSPGAPPQPAPSPSNTVAPLGSTGVTQPTTMSSALPPSTPSQPAYSGGLQNQLRGAQGASPYSTSVTPPKTTMQAAMPEQPTPVDPNGTKPWAPESTSGSGTGWSYAPGAVGRAANIGTNLVPGSMTTMSQANPNPSAPTPSTGPSDWSKAPTPTAPPSDWSKLSQALAPLGGQGNAGPAFGFNQFGGQTKLDQGAKPPYGTASPQPMPGLDLAELLKSGLFAQPNSTMANSVAGGRGRGGGGF